MRPGRIAAAWLSICWGASIPPVDAVESWVGLLEPLGGGGSCLAGETHTVEDPCSLFFGIASPGPGVDLGDWSCRFVSVTGPVETVECTVMEVGTVELVAPPCASEILKLKVRNLHDGSTRLDWFATVGGISCFESYDVIRGAIPIVPGFPGDLGAVDCLIDDTTAASNEGSEDADALAPGQAFFYLVRVNGAPEFQVYGATSDGHERVAASGDCPVQTQGDPEWASVGSGTD
jgi:hypothetical protein